MSDAGRESVFAAVRQALGRRGPETEPEVVTRRLEQPQPNTVPVRGQLQQPELTELFVAMAGQAQATLVRLKDREAIPAAAADFCRDHGLPPAVVLAPASPLNECDWAVAGVSAERRLVQSGDPVAMATAAAGIAETGTLAMLSGPENPVTANFLPDNHLVVIESRDLVGTPEDLWATLRERGVPLPRTVNWVTGPSRSGDIEMTMLMGAHGPVRLHILLIDDSSPG